MALPSAALFPYGDRGMEHLVVDDELEEQGRHPGFVEHRVYPHGARQRAVAAEGPAAATARLPPRPCDGSADAPFKVLAVYPLEYRGKVVMRAHGARPCLSRPA